jgi:aspartate carbamoyltransferase regulatory subunit
MHRLELECTNVECGEVTSITIRTRIKLTDVSIKCGYCDHELTTVHEIVLAE